MKRPRSDSIAAWNAYLASKGLGVVKPKALICTRGKTVKHNKPTLQCNVDPVWIEASKLQAEADKRGEHLPRKEAIRLARKNSRRSQHPVPAADSFPPQSGLPRTSKVPSEPGRMQANGAADSTTAPDLRSRPVEVATPQPRCGAVPDVLN